MPTPLEAPEPSARRPDVGEINTLIASGRGRARRRRLILGGIGALIALGLAAGLYLYLRTADAAAAPAYELVTITRGDLKSSISATGTVEAINNVEVGAEISGRIAAIHVDFNDSVTAGQLLAEIDPEQHEAALAQAAAQMQASRAQVAEARAALVEAELDSTRTRALGDKGLVSTKELESATARTARAQAALQSALASSAIAKASYDAARSRLDKTEIRAPISGTVLSRKVEVGQTINAGMQTPVLFVIAEDLRRMRLSSSVDEADIGAVAAGQAATFTVDAHPDHTFTSRVLAVHNVPEVAQNVVSYEVLLTVDNQELLLKPGMTATVEIVTSLEQDVLLVPNKALRFAPASASRTAMRPPPGMPFLGPSGAKTASQGEVALKNLGRLDGRRAVLWILSGTEPTPLKVEKLATDGTRTAVAGEGLKVGLEVIAGLAATPGGR